MNPSAGEKSAQIDDLRLRDRGLHYLLISGFFFAPHDNFAHIFSCISIELFSPVYVQNKMLCKVCLQGSPVKKAAVVDSFECLVKKGNYYYYYIILFLSRFSTHMFPRAGTSDQKYFPGGGLFSLFHRLKIPIPRYGPGGGGRGDLLLPVHYMETLSWKISRRLRRCHVDRDLGLGIANLFSMGP